MIQNQQNRSSSGHGAGRDPRDAAGRNRQAASPKAATRIAPAGGMAAMALAFLAAFLLAPGAARADQNQCGSLSGAADDPPHTATCGDTHAPSNDGLFTGGIYYTGNNPVNVIVQGSTATTVTSGNNGGWWSAIVLTNGAHASEDRSIDLDVGTTGNVAIVQSSNTDAITWYRHRGIFVRQQAGGRDSSTGEGGSTTDVDVTSRVTIGEPEGTGMGPMSAMGIEATLGSAEARHDDTGAGAITVNSAATIYADLHGISLDNEGPGASTVGHTGAIVAATTAYFAGRTTAGIFVLDRGASGAVTVTSSGDITAGTFTASCSSGGHTAQAACEAASHTWYADGAQANGIFAGTTGKDAAGDDHGVSVTHRAGDIMAGGIGIEAHVGAERDESNTDVGSCSAGGHMTRTDCEGVSETWTATYVMPENEGLVEVAVEGGTIRSKARAINAINYEAGSVEVDVSGGVTLTSTEAAGIWAEVADVGNMSGTVTVNNAGTINAAADDQAGIVALRPAGTGAISVTHSGGTIMAGAQGIRARYGTAAADNGRIHVTVAAGTTVTGATDGIFVENAGEGLQIPKMYAPKAIRDLAAAAGADDLIAMGGLNAAGDTIETPYRNQLVTVEGTVTGGTGAAVHLSGGGAVIVKAGGEVHAGSSGVAIKVNDPGPAHLFIDGTVQGGNAPDSLSEEEQAAHAAVHLYGGSVIIGVNGMVEADGATSAIRGDSRMGEDDPPTRVVFQVATDGTTDDGRRHVAEDGRTVYREGAMAAAARVDGPIAGDGITGEGGGGVFLALADAQGATGMETNATLDADGSLDASGLTEAPPPPCSEGQVRGADGMCAVPPPEPCPEGQVRGADGMCAVPPPEPCPEGQVRGADGMCAVPPPEPCSEGQVRGADGMCAVPPPEPCPEGQVRGADGMCRAMTRPPAMEVVVDESQDEGIRYEYMPEDSDREPIVVTVAAGTTVKSSGDEAGIYLAGAELGNVRMESARGRSLYLRADVMNLRQHFVTVNGTVTGGTGDAAVHLVGGGMLLVGPDGMLNAGTGRPAVLVNDPGEAIIVINGEVKGSTGADAAVHLTGGGSVTVGPGGSVEANGADFAIRGDNEATTVRLLVAADGMTGDRQHVDDRRTMTEGTVTEAGAQAVATGVQGGVTGDGITGPDGGGVKVAVLDSNGDTGMDDPRKVIINSDGSLDFSNFEDFEDRPPPPPPTMNCGSASDERCRLYEALPSALLAMNGIPTYEERTSAVRDAKGGWARVEAARGEWKADSSTQENVAYDHRRHGVRAGMDFAMGDAGGVGVSVHGLRGSAEMTGGGEIDLSGAGVGVHATRALDGGFYVDAQAAVTWYQADLESMLGATLKNDVNGRGYALGVEVGKRLPGMDGGVTVTPRAGLLWSKADLDDFRDARFATVSVKEAQSLRGRAGVGMEKVLDGDGMDGSRLFASLDVEQEFKEETEASLVMVSGTTLKASARKTRIRAAAGAVHAWGEGRYALQGSLGYAAGGGGNRDFGGGLSFAMRF